MVFICSYVFRFSTFQFANVHETLDHLWIDLPGQIRSGGWRSILLNVWLVGYCLSIYLYAVYKTYNITCHSMSQYVNNYMLYMSLGFICYIYGYTSIIRYIVLCHILTDYVYIYIHTCIMFRLVQIDSGISRITHFISYIIPHVCIRSWSTSQNWNKHRHSQVVLWVFSQLPTVRRSFIQSYRPTARPQDLFGEAFACFAWTWDRLSQSPEKAFKWTKFWWGLESPIV